MTHSKRMTSHKSSSSSEDGKKAKKKKKDSDSETSDDSQDTVNISKKKDYKQIVLKLTNAETDYRHQLYPDFHQVLKEDISCTVCFKDLKKDVSSGKTIFSHPKLGVLQCKKCSEVHNDSDCDGLACMWCKSNDDLFSCATCTSLLCEDCIKKNLGKKVLKAAEEDDWQCVLCNPRILWKCRAKCWASFEEAKFIRLKKNKNALSALVEKRKLRTRKPPKRRENTEDMSDEESKSGDDSGDFGEDTSNKGSKGEVRTSEDSDVEDMYSSNREEASKHCVKKRKLRKNRRSSRSFSENKGDETEDSESDADAKQNGETPRLAAKRGKNLSLTPKTNGNLASSDSSSDEDEAHKRRAKGGIDVLLDDFQSIGEMLVDQSKKIKKKFKLAITAGDPNAKPLAIKKLLNVIKVGRDTLGQIERELSILTEGDESVKDAANEVRDVVGDCASSVNKDDTVSTAMDCVLSADMDDAGSTRADVVSAALDDVVSASTNDEAVTDAVDEDLDNIFDASTQELPKSHGVSSGDDKSSEEIVPNEDASSKDAEVSKVPALRIKRLSELKEHDGLEEEPKDVDKNNGLEEKPKDVDENNGLEEKSKDVDENNGLEEKPKDVDENNGLEEKPEDVNLSQDMFAEDSFSLTNTEDSGERSPSLLANAPPLSESSLPLLKDEPLSPTPDAALGENFGVLSSELPDASSDEDCRVGSPLVKIEQDISSDEEFKAVSPPYQDEPNATSDEECEAETRKKSNEKSPKKLGVSCVDESVSRNESDASSGAEKSLKKREVSFEEVSKVASPQNKADDSSDADSVNENEVLAKKGLLNSSSDEWNQVSKKGKKRKLKKRKEGSSKRTNETPKKSAKLSATSEKSNKKARRDSLSDSSSSSGSEEEVHRGEKRAASTEEKPAKKRKPCVEDVNVKEDVKLKAGCVVSVKKMTEEDLEEYLSALQEHYLEEDDSGTDKEIARLGNLSTLRRKKRGGDSDKDSEDDSDKDDNDQEKSSDKRKKIRKPKEKEKGLMEFLDDDETGEQNSGHLDDRLESDKEKSSREGGMDMWNIMNKEFLLEESEVEENGQDESNSEPEVKRAKKVKIKKEKNELDEETAGDEEAVNEEVTEDVKEEVKVEVKEEREVSSSDEKAKKNKKSWRQNRLLVGKLSDTDSDAGNAASQRKEEKRAKEGSEEEEDKKTFSEKESKLSRAKKARRTILKSDSDSDVHSTDKSSSDEAFAKKKKKKVSKATASDDSTEEEKEVKKKPKRRRIKVQDSSSNSDDQQNEKTDTPNKGRKNIHKVIKDDDLVEETKEAAKVEEERRKRIAERQKMYDEMYEELQASATEGQNVDKLVLDFDDKTKEPLVEVHPCIVEKLKPHQVKGIKFMWDACYESLERIKKTKGSGCILAHCMGLGKTFQVVALCHTLLRNPGCKTERILVVSPLSTVLNWCSEFDKWLKGINDDEEEIHVYNLTKQKKNYERQYQLKNWQETGGVMVLGYDMYRNLSNPAGKRVRATITRTFQETLVDPGPDLVICDEGHLLKNEATALAKSMSRIKTLRRVVLTGTPLQNNLKEYHCMVQFVKPNLLGTRKEFLNRFVNPITNGQFDDSSDHDVRVMKRRAHVLHKMLEGSVQRYDYSVLTPFLPPKQEYVISIRVSELQEKLYNHYLSNFVRLSSNGPDEEGGKGRGVALFKDYQNLQRVWTHPLVLKWSMEKQEKEREKREETDSEGSLIDFIDDDEASDTSPDASSSSSSDDDIVCLDDAKDEKKKKGTKGVGRRTRSSKKVSDESEEEVIEEAPKHQLWWEQFVTQDNLEDLRESPKLVLLFSILRECEQLGEKVLVFSQSLYSLDLIEHFLEKIDSATQNGEDDEKLLNLRGSWTKAMDYFRLDGSTAADVRAAWCKTFNRDSNTRGRLFLISTRAGGLGINLVSANRVILFDASWNPSHDLQSIFRVYRFGQKRPVFVYRFLAQGTMEEKIYERQVTKLSLAGRVVDEHQIDRHYNMADLQELYKFTPHSGPKETPKLPKDRMFADMLTEHGQHIVSYHEHDSLLENKQDEELNEEERKEAWEDYEKEKKGLVNPFGGMTPGLPSQGDVINAIKLNFPNWTDEQVKAAYPKVVNDLYKINSSNVALAGQGMAAMQLLRPQSRQPTLIQNLLQVKTAPMPNIQPQRDALSYQQQQMYAFQQQLRNAQYAQRNLQNASYQPTPNAQFLPMYPTAPTQESFRRAYGNSFTNSMPFNQPSTSQGRQPNTKVINIQTPSRK